jgi:hypothetical protein
VWYRDGVSPLEVLHEEPMFGIGGPMRIVRAVTDPDAIAADLHGARAPPRPSPPGQLKSFTPS